MRVLYKIEALKMFLVVFAFLFSLPNIIAQNTDLHFKNFSNKDGLSSNLVNTILKDRYGYMWFGTEDGLNKFDGSNFRVYRHKPGDSTTIAGNAILAMCEDKLGNLWVGTDQSLSFYNRKKDVFINYDFVKNSTARSLAVDHLGNVWVGSYYGLYLYNPQKGILRHYLANPEKAGHLKSNAILSVFEDRHHRIWVGTGRGVHLYVRGEDQFTTYEYSESDSNTIGGNWVQSITESADGCLWFATNGGLSKLLPGGKGFKNYRHIKGTNSLVSNQVSVVAPDHRGRIWVGTEKGLNIIDPATDKISTVNSDLRNKYSLIGNSVRCIYVDKNDIYWIGTYQGGVNKYDENLAFFNLRQSNLLDPFGLSSPIVTSFVEAPSGDLYIGTDGGGLNLLNRKNGLLTHPNLGGTKGKASSILAMERVGNELWIGTYGEGLYILNMLTGAVRQYLQGNGPKNLSGNAIFC